MPYSFPQLEKKPSVAGSLTVLLVLLNLRNCRKTIDFKFHSEGRAAAKTQPCAAARGDGLPQLELLPLYSHRWARIWPSSSCAPGVTACTCARLVAATGKQRTGDSGVSVVKRVTQLPTR